MWLLLVVNVDQFRDVSTLPLSQKMNRPLVDGQGGFAQGFGQGGVGVADVSQVLGAGSELHRGGGFGDQVAGVRGEDVDAQDAVGAGVGQELDATLGFAQGASPARWLAA